MSSRTIKRAGLGLAILLGLGQTACNKDRDESASQVDGGAEAKQAAVDPNLAKAVAAASVQTAARPGAMPEGDGPPPGGVFGAGEADQQLPRGAQPKIVVGELGQQPRLRLTGMQPAPGTAHRFGVDVPVPLGRGASVNQRFSLQLEVPQAGGKGKPDDAEQAPSPAVGGAVAAMIRVADAKLESDQGPRIAQEDLEMFRGLRGATIRLRVAPNGATWDFGSTLPAKADPGLKKQLEWLQIVLATMLLPYPDEAVGKDGFWMVTTRESVSGIDTVTYRLVRVTRVEGDTAVLDVNVKRYAASSRLDPALSRPELGDLSLDTFAATGTATLHVKSGVPAPVDGQLTLRINGSVASSKMPGQPVGAIQDAVTAEIGPALAAAAPAKKKQKRGAAPR